MRLLNLYDETRLEIVLTLIKHMIEICLETSGVSLLCRQHVFYICSSFEKQHLEKELDLHPSYIPDTVRSFVNRGVKNELEDSQKQLWYVFLLSFQLYSLQFQIIELTGYKASNMFRTKF